MDRRGLRGAFLVGSLCWIPRGFLRLGERIFLITADAPKIPTPPTTTHKPRIGIFDIRKAETEGVKFTDGISFVVPLIKKIRSNAHYKQATNLATKVVKDGPVMLFCSSRKAVFTLADYLTKEIDEMVEKPIVDAKQKEKLQRRLRRIIGEEENIYQFFVKGIGIHRGDLPHVIRRIVEDGIRYNALQFLVSTTTLAEGINLPLKTIIIPKPEVAGEKLTRSLFFNLAGRAGRPQKEIEGQIILIASSKYPSEFLEKRYLMAEPKDIERIITPVLHIIELDKKVDETDDVRWKQRYSEAREIHKSVLDTVLLALVIENDITTISENQELVSKILIQSDEKMRAQVKELLKKSETRLIGFEVLEKKKGGLRSTLFGQYVYKTGFSPLSCVKIIEHLESLTASLEDYSITKRNILRNYDAIIGLFQLMNVPIETKAYFPGGLHKNYVSILYKWMRGAYIADIASSYFNKKISDTMLTVGGLLSGFSAWFLYALHILMDYYFEAKERPKAEYLPALNLLPRCCWFGTSNPLALKILELDVSRELLRDDVLRFVTKMGRSLVRRILSNPDLIFEEGVQKRVKTLGLQFEENDFSKILHTILRRR